MNRKVLICYGMLFITSVLVATTFLYLSYTPVTEEELRSDKKLITLNGPWKFIEGDNDHYAEPTFDDSLWENMDLSAPPGMHDDDVGLSGFIPGWTSKGHPNYAGYAWYRMNVPANSLTGNVMALAAPPAVDDAYQLFINGSLVGGIGDFSGATPVVYSIQPRLYPLPAKNENDVTIGFRVWMSPASRGADAGGIHIAPTLGEKSDVEKKYRFQWDQTIKGYIVEVVWPLLFVLMAVTLFLLSTDNIIPAFRWFIAALILLGLMRLNQAVYFWFHIENNRQAVIVGSVILRPLVLGSWLMAWREWFDLHELKWLPKAIAFLTLLVMVGQLFGISSVRNAIPVDLYIVAGPARWALLIILLFIIYQGFRKQPKKDFVVLVAAMLMLIALFPQEISDLHVIPGIWFPYGVGVSRAQFFYVGFVFVMYGVIIRRCDKIDSFAV